MGNVLYIGQYTEGTTSRMRADKIKTLLKGRNHIDVIDTNIPFFKASRIVRSIGFRFKIGPLINYINEYVIRNTHNRQYDLIWVDKGVYLTHSTTSYLRKLSKRIVHFTPDPAFLYHKSSHFDNSCHLYDYLITTKLYELEHYKAICKKSRVIYCTQGYDKNIHYPRHQFEEKQGIVFVGHFEKERGELIKTLLEKGYTVKLAGIKWNKFIKDNKEFKNLYFLGNGIYGNEYAETISSGLFALGSISKWIPELHTTRTFEIPACGTALLTERNSELISFYEEKDVVFYDNINELLEKLEYYKMYKEELKQLIQNGNKKVVTGGFEYGDIIRRILKQVM